MIDLQPRSQEIGSALTTYVVVNPLFGRGWRRCGAPGGGGHIGSWVARHWRRRNALVAGQC